MHGMDNFKVITMLCKSDFPDECQAGATTCPEHSQHIKEVLIQIYSI